MLIVLILFVYVFWADLTISMLRAELVCTDKQQPAAKDERCFEAEAAAVLVARAWRQSVQRQSLVWCRRLAAGLLHGVLFAQIPAAVQVGAEAARPRLRPGVSMLI